METGQLCHTPGQNQAIFFRIYRFLCVREWMKQDDRCMGNIVSINASPGSVTD